MSELATAQTVFANLLRDAKVHEDAEQAFVGTAASLAPRLALYRGNVEANARKALAAAYPVVEQLVGAEFFSGLAREYCRRSPSREGDLTRYGDAFAEFLRDFEHVRELPYLADVASLDWAVHCAHYAADADRFDALQLASRPDEEWGTLRVRLHPACAVLASPWPLARIWSVHQREHVGDRTVPFDEATHRCLVYRPQNGACRSANSVPGNTHFSKPRWKASRCIGVSTKRCSPMRRSTWVRRWRRGSRRG